MKKRFYDRAKNAFRSLTRSQDVSRGVTRCILRAIQFPKTLFRHESNVLQILYSNL